MCEDLSYRKDLNMKYTVVFTHNPQDFYNGEEPAELSKSYVTANLEDDVSKELENGYQVIVTKANGE